MTENYITLFNFNYLPQGLSMYFSLKKNLKDFQLWIVCMDKKVENYLNQRKFKEIRIIPLKKIENLDLLKVKKKRKFIEYCWTLTPFLPSFFFKMNKKHKKITYIDADIFFYKSPKKIIEEFKISKKSVYITEHGFHKKYDHSKISGKFCVQYVIFKNDKKSKKILQWWQNKCLDWCYDYPDKGRLGDQKYLDEWPKLFKKNIHISKNRKYFQGPWTLNRFNTKDKIIYHFHGLKINLNDVIVYNHYGLTKEIIKETYLPYCKALKKTLKEIKFEFFQNIENKKIIDNFKFFLNKFFLNKKNSARYIFNLNKM